MKPLFYGLVDGLSHFHAVVRTVSFEFGFEVRVHLERGHDLADGFAVATAGVVLHVHVRTPQPPLPIPACASSPGRLPARRRPVSWRGVRRGDGKNLPLSEIASEPSNALFARVL